MADASIDSQVLEKPGFLETVKAFMSHETVAKSALLNEQSRSAQLASQIVTKDARIKELETASASVLEASTGAAKENAALQATVKELTAKIATLEATAQTAERKAASLLANMGIPPVAGVTDTGREKGTEKTFSTLVSEHVKLGKTKGAAVQFCIAQFPAEYAKAKAAGDVIL